MLSAQAHNEALINPSAKIGGKKLLMEQPKPERELASQFKNDSPVKWELQNDNGKLKLTPIANTSQVDVTTVAIQAEEVQAPPTLRFLGQKIDLSGKIAELKDNYIKNYTLSKSHNLMVARFAELKTAATGYLLSLCGVTSEDLKKLRDKALQAGIHQNKQLFAENEYNSELLTVVGGGGKKQMRAQQRVISEIRTQLITQANNLGLANHYTQERIIETQIEQCQKILQKFSEEKANLEYQLAYLGVQKSVN